MDVVLFTIDNGMLKVSFFAVAVLIAALLSAMLMIVLLLRWLRVKNYAEFKIRYNFEQFYQMLFMAPDGYFSWFYNYDDKKPKELCSGRLAVILGLDKGVNSTFDDVLAKIIPVDREVFKNLVDELIKKGKNFACEIKLIDSKRRVIAIGCRGRNSSELLLCDTIWMRDITKTSDSMDELYSENKYVEYKYNFVKSIIDSFPFPLWARDENLMLNYCNNAYVNAVDANSIDEVLANSIEIAEGAGLTRLKTMASLARQEKKFVEAKEHIVIGNKRRFVALSEQFLEGGEGDFRRSTVGMVIPLDEQEDLSLKLKDYMNAHDGILQNLTTAIAIFDSDTRLSFYNNTFLQLLTLSSDYLDAKPTYSSFLEALREKRMLPEVRNFSAFKTEELELFKSVVKPKEGLWALPNGKILRRFMMLHPLGGLLISFEDVTDRYALETSYRTLIEVQKATIDNIHEAVILLDATGHLKLHNAFYAKLWNLDEDFLEGNPTFPNLVDKFKEFFTEDDKEWEAFKQEIISFLIEEGGEKITLERRDGLILEVVPTRLADGGTLITFEDVTSEVRTQFMQKQTSKIMTKKNAIRSKFINDLAGEFDKPLKEICDLSKKVNNAYSLTQKIVNMQKDFNDVMNLARVEVNNSVWNLQIILVADVLAQIAMDINDRLKENSVEIVFDVKETVSVSVDKDRFYQMLFYIIVSLVKITYKGGVLKVSLKRNAEDNSFKINFNPNVAVREVQDLTTLFFGAGASLVVAICSMLGGRISFEKTGKFISLSLIFNDAN